MRPYMMHELLVDGVVHYRTFDRVKAEDAYVKFIGDKERLELRSTVINLDAAPEPQVMAREAMYTWEGALRGYVLAMADDYGMWWTYETPNGTRSLINWPDRDTAAQELPKLD